MKITTKQFATAAAALAMALATAAWAQPNGSVFGLSSGTVGYTYFNRPGASLAEHTADLEQCRRIIAGAAGTTLGDGFGLAGAMMNGVVNQNGFEANMENCMVVHGWRVVRLPTSQGARIFDARRQGRNTFDPAWISAETPVGEVVRVWRNEANDENVYRCCGVQMNDIKSLSYAAAPEFTPRPLNLRSAPLPRRNASSAPPRPLTAEQLTAIPAGQALILVEVAGAYNGFGVGFRRVSSNPATPAWVQDQQPDDFHAPLPTALLAAAFRHRQRVLAFTVPEGQWLLHRYGNPEAIALNFCLGAPAMEVKSGEVIFAGAFELTHGPLAPNLSLEPARQFLAGRPDLAGKLRAAVWTNGHRFACDTQFSYAFEIPGAPFEPGYDLASQRPSRFR